MAMPEDIEREYLALKATHAGGMGTRRVVIRTSRISAGLLLALVGFLILGATPTVSDTPFASLTLGMLVGSAFGWGCAVFAWGCAWAAAFGAAPTQDEVDCDLMSKARRNVQARQVAGGG